HRDMVYNRFGWLDISELVINKQEDDEYSKGRHSHQRAGCLGFTFKLSSVLDVIILWQLNLVGNPFLYFIDYAPQISTRYIRPNYDISLYIFTVDGIGPTTDLISATCDNGIFLPLASIIRLAISSMDVRCSSLTLTVRSKVLPSSKT